MSLFPGSRVRRIDSSKSYLNELPKSIDSGDFYELFVSNDKKHVRHLGNKESNVEYMIEEVFRVSVPLENIKPCRKYMLYMGKMDDIASFVEAQCGDTSYTNVKHKFEKHLIRNDEFRKEGHAQTYSTKIVLSCEDCQAAEKQAKAAKDQRIAQDKAAQAQRIAQDKAAETQRIAQDKAAQEHERETDAARSLRFADAERDLVAAVTDGLVSQVNLSSKEDHVLIQVGKGPNIEIARSRLPGFIKWLEGSGLKLNNAMSTSMTSVFMLDSQKSPF